MAINLGEINFIESKMIIKVLKTFKEIIEKCKFGPTVYLNNCTIEQQLDGINLKIYSDKYVYIINIKDDYIGCICESRIMPINGEYYRRTDLYDCTIDNYCDIKYILTQLLLDIFTHELSRVKN